MKNRGFFHSFNNAASGIIHGVKTERNMKIHIAAAVFVFAASLYFDLSATEFAVVCVTVAMVIVSELFNTAVEIVVDIIVDVYHPKARIIKDIAAGAVLVSALNSLLVAYFIFYDRARELMQRLIAYLRVAPVYLPAATLALTATGSLLFKVLAGKGARRCPGLPSGHAAIGFALATALALLTGNLLVTMLALLVALLVAHNRYETGASTVSDVFFGSLIGTFSSLLLYRLFHP